MDGEETSLGKVGEEKKGSRHTLWLWIKDFLDVGLTVLVLIVVLRLAFGSHTLVPLVVVTSGSMVHVDNGWHDWLVKEFGDETLVDSLPFQSGFVRGDMIFTVSPNKYHLIPDTRLGDVIVYDRDLAHLRRYGSNEPIIHRIVGVVWVEKDSVVKVNGSLTCLNNQSISNYITLLRNCRESKGECVYPTYPAGDSYRLYITKGDNNLSPDQCGINGGIAYPVNEKQLKARGWIRLPYVGWIKLVFNWILQISFWLIKFLISLLPI